MVISNWSQATVTTTMPRCYVCQSEVLKAGHCHEVQAQREVLARLKHRQQFARKRLHRRVAFDGSHGSPRVNKYAVSCWYRTNLLPDAYRFTDTK
jgi:hypothetical protein